MGVLGPDGLALEAALAAALRFHDAEPMSVAGGAVSRPLNLADARLERLPDKGLAHEHVRLAGTGLLARIPKQSQLGLDAASNLAYQAACFERASASGHAPHLHSVMAPSVWLPRGALLVEEIAGSNARLPQDLDAIVRALASIHKLPVPAPALRAPLIDAPDPLAALLAEVQAQARFVGAQTVTAEAARLIDACLKRLRGECLMTDRQDRPVLQDRPERPKRCLISFDGHPGNFIVREERAQGGREGKAVLVDLEKCRYSYPGLDLAHATLYTSTTWDIDSHAVLGLDAIAGAYSAWEQLVPAQAQRARPWHVPLRRAMWLWSVTWCAKWRALSGAAASTRADGEDWSAGRSEDRLIAHVRGRVDDYLDLATIERMLGEFEQLEKNMSP